ncbi:MAG TPA: HAMP domain-containing sensor histidine kinase [Chloroflexota bacterium]|nr:HAMP domain-containing sensor histidine kinase [Chloroflexota bacterium]
MRSLGVRLALWYGLGVAIVLLLLGGFLYAGLNRYLRNEALTLLRTQAVPLQRLVAEQQAGAGRQAELRTIVNQIVERPAATGVGVWVLGPNARLIGQSRTAADQGLSETAVEQLRGIARGQGEDSTIVTANGQRFLLLLRPLTIQGRLVGALVLTTSLAAADQTLHGFVIILLIGIGATLLVTSLVVVVVTRIGLQPLRDMGHTAHQIADGDLSQRVSTDHTMDEVGELATSFNYMAEKLQAAWQAQRQFAADASHELRTPLTSLAGYIDVLNRGAKDDPSTLNRVLASMRGEVDRMTRLVRDLVSLARLDAGDELRLQRLDLTHLVEDVYEQTKAMAPGREINLRATEPAWVEVDVDRMRQVLLNLADNALKYTPPEAHVNFAVQSYDSTVQVSVADNGPGIDPQDREHLFDRFYRAEQSRTREKGGAGLGLSIARKIVEAHRGSIGVACPPEGGTVFSVRLPLAG